MVNVTIYRGRDHNNSCCSLVRLKVFGEVERVSHGSGGTDQHETCEAEASADLERSALLFSGTKFIPTTADVVIAAEVDKVCEVFACHYSMFICHQAINAIDEANKFDVAALGLISKQAINDIVAAWCLSTHENQADLLSFRLVNSEHTSVKVTKLNIAVVKMSCVGNKVVLDLDKIVICLAVLESRERYIHLGRHDLSRRNSAFGCGK